MLKAKLKTLIGPLVYLVINGAVAAAVTWLLYMLLGDRV